MIVIEKNIPVPARVTGKRSKYPWQQMEIGDSFFTESNAIRALISTRHKVYPARYKYANEGNGVRVWRIA